MTTLRDVLDRPGGPPLPSAEEEDWRYSRIAELDLDAYELDVDGTAAAPPAEVPEELRTILDAVGERSALVVVRNGAVALVEVDEAMAARGLSVGRGRGAPVAEPADAFDALHERVGNDGVVVQVPPNLVVPAPVVVLHWTDADGRVTLPSLVVDAGANSEVTVLEHLASTDVDALVVPRTELHAGDAARLRYANVQLLGQRVWQLGRQSSRVGRDAGFLTAMVALGGDYARLRIESAIDGRGGSGQMLAVYFGEGTQMHDFRTLQDHIAPSTTSDLLFKGVVEDRARSVYTGLIHIGKAAAGVNAYQTNRNVKLSADAWAESVPNLEIENNDVRCSHASTIGPVDEEQAFYLQSRGVPPGAAERLIVLGFFDEVLERLPVPGIVGLLREEVGHKFDRRDEAADVAPAAGGATNPASLPAEVDR